MATHGAPAQPGRPLPPVFQASASNAASSSGAQHHRAHRPHSSGNIPPTRDASPYEIALGLIAKGRAWYHAPCSLPPHRRETALKMALFLSLIFVFIFLFNCIGAAWRAKRASRLKKAQ